MPEVRDWKVARWIVWDGDTEPSPGIVYEGDQDGARRVFDQYAAAGEVVELRYQPPRVTPPEELIDHTHKTARCGINVWQTSRWANPCFLPKGHDGPHRAALQNSAARGDQEPSA